MALPQRGRWGTRQRAQPGSGRWRELVPRASPFPGGAPGTQSQSGPVTQAGRAESPLKGRSLRTYSLGQVVLVAATDTNRSPTMSCVSRWRERSLSVSFFLLCPPTPSIQVSVRPSVHPSPPAPRSPAFRRAPPRRILLPLSRPAFGGAAPPLCPASGAPLVGPPPGF